MVNLKPLCMSLMSAETLYSRVTMDKALPVSVTIFDGYDGDVDDVLNQ